MAQKFNVFLFRMALSAVCFCVLIPASAGATNDGDKCDTFPLGATTCSSNNSGFNGILTCQNTGGAGRLWTTTMNCAATDQTCAIVGGKAQCSSCQVACTIDPTGPISPGNGGPTYTAQLSSNCNNLVMPLTYKWLQINSWPNNIMTNGITATHTTSFTADRYSPSISTNTTDMSVQVSDKNGNPVTKAGCPSATVAAHLSAKCTASTTGNVVAYTVNVLPYVFKDISSPYNAPPYTFDWSNANIPAGSVTDTEGPTQSTSSTRYVAYFNIKNNYAPSFSTVTVTDSSSPAQSVTVTCPSQYVAASGSGQGFCSTDNAYSTAQKCYSENISTDTMKSATGFVKCSKDADCAPVPAPTPTPAPTYGCGGTNGTQCVKGGTGKKCTGLTDITTCAPAPAPACDFDDEELCDTAPAPAPTTSNSAYKCYVNDETANVNVKTGEDFTFSVKSASDNSLATTATVEWISLNSLKVIPGENPFTTQTKKPNVIRTVAKITDANGKVEWAYCPSVTVTETSTESAPAPTPVCLVCAYDSNNSALKKECERIKKNYSKKNRDATVYTDPKENVDENILNTKTSARAMQNFFNSHKDCKNILTVQVQSKKNECDSFKGLNCGPKNVATMNCSSWDGVRGHKPQSIRFKCSANGKWLINKATSFAPASQSFIGFVQNFIGSIINGTMSIFYK